jgi:histidine kinase
MITVQDRDYRLLRFNQDFAERFDPRVGDYCYMAYKGQGSKCVNCPVERTFIDGQPHYGEESGVNKDGTEAYWIFRTSPIFDAEGQVVAAMEMSLDITERKLLERKLEKSERKYHEIFNNIPNPVFVLDFDTLEILDCNESVTTDYTFTRDDVLNTSFLDLFMEQDKEKYRRLLRSSTMLNQVKHRGRGDKIIFVNIRISPSDFPGKKSSADHDQRHHQASRSRAAVDSGQQNGHPGRDGDRDRPRVESAPLGYQDRQQLLCEENKQGRRFRPSDPAFDAE